MAGPVLLVHDDISTIATVRRLLGREGFETLLATSAADALIAFGHYLPSVILLAPTVEGNRGDVVMQELMQHPDGQLARVILLGETLPGFSAPVVPLPLDGEFLLETVRQVLGAPAAAESQPPAPEEAWQVTSPLTAEVPAPAPVEEPEPWRASVPREGIFQAMHPAPEPQEWTTEADASSVRDTEAPSDVASENLSGDPGPVVPEAAAAEAPPPDSAPYPADGIEAGEGGERHAPDEDVGLQPPAPDERAAEEERARAEEEVQAKIRLAAAREAQAFHAEQERARAEAQAAAEERARSEAEERRFQLSAVTAPAELRRNAPALRGLGADLASAFAPQGDVTLEALCRLMSRLVSMSATGRLELRAPDALRVLWVDQGTLAGAASSLPAESLLERAYRDGLVDSSHVRELRLLRAGSEAELLRTMLERGHLREAETVPLLQRYTEQIALEALSEPRTSYRWTDGAQPSPSERTAAPRPLKSLVTEALRRTLTPELVLTRVRGLRSVPHWSTREPWEGLGWTEPEHRMLVTVDGERPLEALLREAGVRQEVGLRAVAIAEALGLLGLTVSSAPAASANVELEAQRLNAKWASAEEADYFAILGLARTAGAEEVQRAFRTLSEEFHPLRFVAHPDPALQARAAQLQALLSEAAAALGDDGLRRSYARHLSSEG